ncbi:MAG: cytochrome P450 [Actinobacteria bacterium]|nr:cytochrome P450 [Actinomycetota bacterium]
MKLRRANPTDDLLSGLIQSENQGQKLTEEEMLTTCVLLLVAGHETTVNLIANGVLALLRNPDQVGVANEGASASGWRNLVEEVLRFDPPVQLTSRVAREPMKVGGYDIDKGQEMILLVGSANRDPEAFDQPDRFDVSRVKNPHVSFSNGIHFCLGAPLARLEGRMVLQRLFERLPTMSLSDEALVYKPNIVLRGLTELQVKF